MMKYYVCCLFWIACFLSKAQDTIFTASPNPLLVRVLEISDKEVRYKNFYNPDGVIRAISNAEVWKIVYENGQEEARFKNRQPAGANTSFSLTPFVIEGRHLVYRNEDIAHQAAFKIMMQRDFKKNSDELNEVLTNIERNRIGQVSFLILSPACLLGGAYLARYNYYGPNDAPKARTFLLSGAGLCVGTFITSMIYKSVKNRNIRRAASIYNNEI